MAFKLENIQKENRALKHGQSGIEAILKKELFSFGNKFNDKKKQAFYQELATLLKAGITIKEALTLIMQSTKKASDKELMDGIISEIIQGLSLSEALLKTQLFSEYEYYSLQIGEETGTIAQVCHELKMFYERKNEQRRIVIAALTYPSIVLSTAVLVVFFMLSYVVPMFEDIFRQNKMELPALTRIIIKLSNFIQAYGFYSLVLIVVFFILGKFFNKNQKYKSVLHYMILKIPILGPFTKKVYLAQFTQALALLTTAKIPILNSIQMVRKMILFVPLQNALTQVENSILKGNSLSTALEEDSIFDNRIISLVRVAEETNQTEYVFGQLNEQYSQEVIQQSKMMTTILEPFIILIVGVLVAVLLVAMYLPMFQLSSAIG